MKINIVGRPTFYIPFTGAQINMFIKQSSSHYDAKCSSASCVGGFLYGWKNQLDWAKEEKRELDAFYVPWDNLDLLAKITENVHVLTNDEMIENTGVRNVIFALFRRSNELINEWDVTEEFIV